MTLTLDCDSARHDVATGQGSDEEGGMDVRSVPQSEETAGGLTTVQVTEGEGRFFLAAPLSSEEQRHVKVDIASHSLRLCSGRISRWVAVPQDALVNEAVVDVSEGLLTVSIPVQERRKVRHVVHVW